MPNYVRPNIAGGTYFFTVVTYQRRPILVEPKSRDVLRFAIEYTRNKLPFSLDAICLLPDHIHCIWTLPENDFDISTRWRYVKATFSRLLLSETRTDKVVSASRQKHRDVDVWQRRYWDHWIRDDEDYARHLDYLHYNPVKHGLVPSVSDWPWSSFHRFVRLGYYELGWGSGDFRPGLEELPVGGE